MRVLQSGASVNVTKRTEVSAAELAQHVRDLSAAFDITVVRGVTHHDASYVKLYYHPNSGRVEDVQVVCAPIDGALAYIACLHEMGHALHPNGMMRHNFPRDEIAAMSLARRAALLFQEETSAWDWAYQQSLVWNTACDVEREKSLATYGGYYASGGRLTPASGRSMLDFIKEIKI